jgi:hypothetical protein
LRSSPSSIAGWPVMASNRAIATSQ